MESILVVDDSEFARLHVCGLLDQIAHLQFCVKSASNIKDALQICLQEPVDCLLLDYEMPGGTGLDLMRQLHAHGLSLKIPVLFLTARGSEEIAASAFREGVGDYLPKRGLTAERLGEVLSACLDKARWRRQLADSRGALEGALSEAQEASQIKSRFLANMSHEIRTPLNGIMGIANLLGDTPLSSEQVELVRLLESSSENLLTIVNDILDLSKIEAEKISLEEHDFDLGALVEFAIDVFRRARTQSVEVSCQVHESVPTRVLGDPGRVRQVLNNLLSNAVKFTESGSVRTTLSSPAQGVVEIVVSDTGIGMDAEQLSRVFEAYCQADENTTRRYGGTGLGLSIARKLAEMMGGGLTATSEPGAGTRMTFRFKAERASDQAAQAPPTQQVGSPVARPHVPLRVFVAEDNPVNRKIVSAFLKKLGHTVGFANDGRAAVLGFAPTDYDIALIDLQMPLVDGFGVLRAMRKTLAGRKFPIIALTADAMSGCRERCLEAGFDGYLSKPMKIEALGDLLRTHAPTPGSGQVSSTIRRSA